jgi:small subunit ribosomal protein S9
MAEEQVSYYATGRRKTAVARVWLMPGTGNITINGKPAREYLGRFTLEAMVNQPFAVTNTEGQFDVIAYCKGGGISGHAGAVRMGIARALIQAKPELRPTLRQLGIVTRDPRVKERKKYGRKRARRAFQYVKR